MNDLLESLHSEVVVEDSPYQFGEVSFQILGIVFVAYCIWLTVRIVNRRERWAKRTAAGLVIVLAYPLSFGPACWLADRLPIVQGPVTTAYRPLAAAAARGPTSFYRGIEEYGECGSPPSLPVAPTARYLFLEEVMRLTNNPF
jgi:hypothetical protein